MATDKDTYYRLSEHNSWEGETWYHYFIDQPGVLEALKSILSRLDGHDLEGVKTIELSDEEATILANFDNGNYMRPHWFGELNTEKLSLVSNSDDLYKGKIRDYAEDLFEMVRAEAEEAAK